MHNLVHIFLIFYIQLYTYVGILTLLDKTELIIFQKVFHERGRNRWHVG